MRFSGRLSRLAHASLMSDVVTAGWLTAWPGLALTRSGWIPPHLLTRAWSGSVLNTRNGWASLMR